MQPFRSSIPLEELKLVARRHRVRLAVCKKSTGEVILAQVLLKKIPPPRHIVRRFLSPPRRSLTKCLASENSFEFRSLVARLEAKRLAIYFRTVCAA